MTDNPVLNDAMRVQVLERQLGQARRVMAELRHLVCGLEQYAPRRHAVRQLHRRVVQRHRTEAA